MRFKNKVALITAGGNGIGRATAKIMVSEGATVIVADNHQGHLDEAVPSLREAAGKSGGKVAGRADRRPRSGAGRKAGRPTWRAITAPSTSWSTRSAAAR